MTQQTERYARHDRLAAHAGAVVRAESAALVDVEREWQHFLALTADTTVAPTTIAGEGNVHVLAFAREARRRRLFAGVAAASLVAAAAAAIVVTRQGHRDLGPAASTATTAGATVPASTRPGPSPSPTIVSTRTSTTTSGTGDATIEVTSVVAKDVPAVLAATGANYAVSSETPGFYAWHGARNPKPIVRAAAGIDVSIVNGFIVEHRASADGAVRSLAYDPWGTKVCDVQGDLFRIRRISGTAGFVASVVRRELTTFGARDVPTFAVDCTTHKTTLIQSAATVGDGGGTATFYVGAFQFTGTYDAEGNERITTPQGLLVTGQDTAGYASFNEAGTFVAYGVIGNQPHDTDAVRVRNAQTGATVLDAKVRGSVRAVWWVGDRLVVGTKADGADEDAPLNLNVLDASGRLVKVVTTPVKLVTLNAGIPDPLGTHGAANTTP